MDAYDFSLWRECAWNVVMCIMVLVSIFGSWTAMCVVALLCMVWFVGFFVR